MNADPSDESTSPPRAALESKQAARPKVAFLRGVLRTTFVLASPAVFYYAVTRLAPLPAAGLVGGWVALRAVEPLLSATPEQRWDVAKLPLVGLLFSGLSAIVGTPWILLLIPSALQFSFAFLFANSLRSGTPLVERFARMHVPDLPADEAAYCRTVTKVWAVYLVAIGLVALGMAPFASPEVWAVFTGIGSYALVAALFAIEYGVRTARFRQRYDGIAHRFFRWILD